MAHSSLSINQDVTKVKAIDLHFSEWHVVVFLCAQLVDQWLKRARTSLDHSYLSEATAHTVRITLPQECSFPPALEQWYHQLELLREPNKI